MLTQKATIASLAGRTRRGSTIYCGHGIATQQNPMVEHISTPSQWEGGQTSALGYDDEYHGTGHYEWTRPLEELGSGVKARLQAWPKGGQVWGISLSLQWGSVTWTFPRQGAVSRVRDACRWADSVNLEPWLTAFLTFCLSRWHARCMYVQTPTGWEPFCTMLSNAQWTGGEDKILPFGEYASVSVLTDYQGVPYVSMPRIHIGTWYSSGGWHSKDALQPALLAWAGQWQHPIMEE